jgi:hypothetical protein
VFLVNSRLAHFSATPVRFRGEPLHAPRHTFSRSYGVNLPSSFATLHSSALGFSPHLPVSVCGTVTSALLRGFSRQRGIGEFTALRPPHSPSALNERADLPTPSAYRPGPGHPTPGTPSLLRPPLVITSFWWFRNINRISIGYAFRPRLRDRLTLSGLTLLRNP